jgi:hypothetical protein
VVAEPIVDSPVNMAATPIVGYSMIKNNDEEEPVFRNLLPIMRRSNNNLVYRMCHIMNLLEDLRGL